MLTRANAGCSKAQRLGSRRGVQPRRQNDTRATSPSHGWHSDALELSSPDPTAGRARATSISPVAWPPTSAALYHLSPTPPRWCYERHLWPYDDVAKTTAPPLTTGERLLRASRRSCRPQLIQVLATPGTGASFKARNSATIEENQLQLRRCSSRAEVQSQVVSKVIGKRALRSNKVFYNAWSAYGLLCAFTLRRTANIPYARGSADDAIGLTQQRRPLLARTPLQGQTRTAVIVMHQARLLEASRQRCKGLRIEPVTLAFEVSALSMAMAMIEFVRTLLLALPVGHNRRQLPRHRAAKNSR